MKGRRRRGRETKEDRPAASFTLTEKEAAALEEARQKAWRAISEANVLQTAYEEDADDEGLAYAEAALKANVCCDAFEALESAALELEVADAWERLEEEIDREERGPSRR